MLLFPMDAPARLHRRIAYDVDTGRRQHDVVVAEGPLVILAHGLCAIEPEMRGCCWISSEAGTLNADEAEEVLRAWSTPAEGAHEEADGDTIRHVYR